MKLKSILLLVFVLIGKVSLADIYQVDNIQIVSEQETTALAQKTAIQQGQADAFRSLIERMVLPENRDQLPFVEATEIDNFVKTVSVSNEKTTPTKYMANLSVQFKPEAIKNFFIQNRIPFMTETMPKALLIPVFQGSEETLIFEENNPLLQSLKENPIQGKLFMPILPMGDLEDMASAYQALSQTSFDWQALMNKYEVSHVFVLTLTQRDSEYDLQAEFIPNIYHDSFQITDSLQIDNDDFAYALKPYIIDAVENKWLSENMNDLSQPLTYWIQVSVENLGIWQSIETKLKKADFMENLSVRAFRPKEVVITVQYQGEKEQLNAQLNKLGFDLVPSDTDDILLLQPYQPEKTHNEME